MITSTSYHAASRAKLLLNGSFIALAASALFAIPGTALAQDAALADQTALDAEAPEILQDSYEVSDIVVTGSRIVRDGYEAPTPTTVVGIEQINASAPANIADYVNQLPQLGGSTTPRTAGAGVGGGTGGANFLNTRNLGPTRTLTLLNGRRVVGSATTGAVDVNLLPTALISRVDVVTGGASAAYGSDAVAGVVNFVLDTKFRGVKGSIQRGMSTHGDAGTVNASLTYGTGFASDRGHFLLSGQYAQADSVDNASSRDWYEGWNRITNPNWTETNGQPGNLLLSGVGLARATDGGLIYSGPLRGTQFGPGGTVLDPFVFGTVQNGLIQSGGTPNDVAGRFQLLPPLEQQSYFTRVSYDLTNSLTAYAEGSFGKSDVTTNSSPYVRHGDITISAENPFIPAGVPLDGVTSFNMGRTNFDLGIPGGHNERELRRVVVGLDGQFLSTGRWNAYYQYGETKILNEILRDPIKDNFNRAVDVVRNPASGGVAGVAAGDPVCRSTLTDPTNGCQPMNIFGYGSPSAASIAYVNGVARQNVSIRQDVAALSGQFEPFSLPAGPVSLAGGIEYRKEQYTADADALSLTNSWWVGNYKPGSGEYDVKEGFVEVIAPVLSDLPFVKMLEFNGAARVTEYSTSGSVTTWKAGLTYDINDDLRLRGTLSRDIRAPNLNDLFLGGQSNSIGVQDVLTAGAPNVFITQITGGNPDLKPEEADTTAFGIVYKPSWLTGFSASVDYYDILIDGAITSQTADTIIAQCYGFGRPQVSSACSAITLTRPDTLAGAMVRVGGVNVQSLQTTGFDIEFGYRTELADISPKLAGKLDLRAIGTHVTKFESQLGGTMTDNLNVIGNALEWRWLGTASYAWGPSRTTATVRYIGPAVYNNYAPGTALSVDKNDIDSVTYLDLSTTYDVEFAGASGQLFAVVENVLDTDPPIVGGNNYYASYGADSTYHDTIGRSVRVGVRFQF